MEFRKTQIEDVEEILEIIDDAKAYLKSKGIDQWQNGYPNKDVILEDIKLGYSYVLLDDNKVIATAAISFDGEITYNKILDGNWLSDEDSNNKYAVIHRIAVAKQYRGHGISSILIHDIENLCKDYDIKSIRVDTHKENTSMQNLLKKHNFKYCGWIYLLDKSMRNAYEKLVE